MKSVIDWLYEDRIPEDPEILADIYGATIKYHLEKLSAYIIVQIKKHKDNAKFIISMIKVALEQKNEKLISQLVPIFKANSSWYQHPEFKRKLEQHSLQLMKYFMQY
jgi:hypothetical protein